MIATKMREYKYFRYVGEDEYGQAKLSDKPIGTVKVAIYLISEQPDGTIKFCKGMYQGVTLDKEIDDTYVIKYGKQLLKVTSVTPSNLYRIVYLTRI